MASGQVEAAARSRDMCVYATPTAYTSDCQGYPGTGSTTSSTCVTSGSDTACGTTYDAFNGGLLAMSSLNSGSYYDAVAITCSSTGYHATTWSGPYTAAGNGTGNQFLACPGGTGDNFVSGFGGIVVF